MTYVCKVKPENELVKEIDFKIEESQAKGDTQSIKIGKTFHDFIRINMRRDDLLFNTENDRTLTHTREFCISEGHNSDYFDIQNASQQHVQQDYFNIIQSFVPQKMRETLDSTLYQRDPIYINRSGIVANGNTRLAYFRDSGHLEFELVECLVIPEDFNTDWSWIRRMVDAQDNAPKFSADYPWYARAERMESNLELTDKSPSNFKRIASEMEYNTVKEAELHRDMLKIARIFVQTYSKTFKQLSDLDSESRTKQAIETLAKAYLSINNQKLPPNLRKYLLTASFEVMESKEKAIEGGYSSVHLSIAGLWTEENTSEVLREFNAAKSTSSPKILSGEKKSKKAPAAPNFFENPGLSDDDKARKLKDLLGKSLLRKQAGTSAKKKRLFLKELQKINTTLVNITDDFLNDDTDTVNTEVELQTLQDQLTRTMKKEKSIRKNQEKI